MKLAQEVVFRTSEPAYAVERGGQIVAWNEAAAGAIGYSDSEAVGRKCWELLCGQDSFGNQYCCEGCPIRASLFRQETVNRFQVNFKTASYELKNFTVSALLLRSCAGKDFMIGLMRHEPINKTTTPNDFNGKRVWSQGQRGNLTQREHEVLILLADGNSTGEISSVICISVYTVRNHIQHILNKLQVNSRLQAITLGQRLDII